MKLAICNELYFDRSFEAACQHASEVGYQGMELAPFTLGESPGAISASTRRSVCRSAKQHGLQIVGLHWLLAKTEGLHLTSEDPAVQQRTRTYLRELVELCSDLGGQVMVLGSPQQRSYDVATNYATACSRAKHLIQDLAPVLESHSVTLALEPLGPEETNFLTTAEATIELIRAIDSPQVRLILDVKAMSTESTPIPAIIDQSQDYLVHFHANDPNRQGPGMGAVDFVPILDALQAIDYDGWISVEVFDYSPGIETLATASYRNLQTSQRGGNPS